MNAYECIIYQVYEETVVSRDGSSATGSFLLDAPLGRNVRIVAHCADEADVDTIEVVSPSGRVYDLPLVADGMLHIRIPHTDEVGTGRGETVRILQGLGFNHIS